MRERNRDTDRQTRRSVKGSRLQFRLRDQKLQIKKKAFSLKQVLKWGCRMEWGMRISIHQRQRVKLPAIPRKKPWKEKQVESKNHTLCLAILLKQGSQFGQTVPALGRNTLRAPDRKAKTWKRPEKKQCALGVSSPLGK